MKNLSDLLQNEITAFLEEYNSDTLSNAINELLLYYIQSKSELGLDLVIQENLKSIRALIKIFDEVNKLK